MTTNMAVQPDAAPREVQFAQLLVALTVLAGLGTALFISMADNHRSIDDVFVASNGGINRISPDGAERVDWVVNLDNPLTAHLLRNQQDSFLRQQWRVTEVVEDQHGRWAGLRGDFFPVLLDSPLDDWDPPASDFRPITGYGAQVALLAAALTVLAVYHPDVRIAVGGLVLGVVGILLVLVEAVPLQFGLAVPVAFGALAVQYIRALPNRRPASLTAIAAAVLAFMSLLAWKFTTAVPLRNVIAVQLLLLPILVTGARLATEDR